MTNAVWRYHPKSDRQKLRELDRSRWYSISLSQVSRSRPMPETAPLNNSKILPSNFYLLSSRNSWFLAAKNKYVPLYRQSFYQLRADRRRAFERANICLILAFVSLLRYKKVNLAKN